ncbi:MAG TPA: hypothetical protein VK054_02765 [Beutenbergiaceae bacterium]|nr:hypothetical protein [Beutenbergiaceae bacterium]
MSDDDDLRMDMRKLAPAQQEALRMRGKRRDQRRYEPRRSRAGLRRQVRLDPQLAAANKHTEPQACARAGQVGDQVSAPSSPPPRNRP